MMDVRLKPVGSAESMSRLRRLYEESFPIDERRPWTDISGETGRMQLRGIYVGDDLAGMVTTWRFPKLVYVEHFAVEPSLRGQGIGREVVGQLIKEASPDALVLESEPESLSLEARRRISFYRSCGLTVIDRDYVQPPYAEGLPEVPLWLMASQAGVDGREAGALLRREVYGVTG